MVLGSAKPHDGQVNSFGCMAINWIVESREVKFAMTNSESFLLVVAEGEPESAGTWQAEVGARAGLPRPPDGSPHPCSLPPAFCGHHARNKDNNSLCWEHALELYVLLHVFTASAFPSSSEKSHSEDLVIMHVNIQPGHYLRMSSIQQCFH